MNTQLKGHHYPEVPNFGDMTKFKEWPDANVDVLVGGTPCQSFSVAGLRKGMADPRGNLALVYLAIAAKYRPEWLVWENVPGVLSSNGGRDFGSFLGALVELGYGYAYRVLDAQYFGVAQRRRRVFVVANLGDWRRAAAVLFDAESLSGNPAPRRKTRQGTTAHLEDRIGGSGEAGTASDGAWPAEIAPTLTADYGAKMGLNNQHVFNQRGGHLSPETAKCLVAKTRLDSETETLIPIGGCFDVYAIQPNMIDRADTAGCNGKGYSADGVSYTLTKTDIHAVAFHPTQDPISSEDVCHSLGANSNATAAVAFEMSAWEGGRETDVSPTLDARSKDGPMRNQVAPAVLQNMAVRRLTPVECERLQGFPDDYSSIPWRGKDADQCPDGPRYKALGNSMAVPVMRWIGERIQAVSDQRLEQAA